MEKTIEELEVEISRLTQELEEERRKNRRLTGEIAAAKEQEVNMAVHNRRQQLQSR